jgi:Trp operon repressor
MVHVSRHPVKKQIMDTLLSDLSELFLANTRKSDSSKTLFELLSGSERIMLAKRVGIINALIHNYSTYETSILFKVSTSTVARIQEEIERGTLNHVVHILKNKSGRAKLVKTFEQIVTFGFPGVPQKRLREKLHRDIEAWRAGGT